MALGSKLGDNVPICYRLTTVAHGAASHSELTRWLNAPPSERSCSHCEPARITKGRFNGHGHQTAALGCAHHHHRHQPARTDTEAAAVERRGTGPRVRVWSRRDPAGPG